MRHYLVTGGAGFIGSHLVDALLARGDRVRVLDNLATGRERNLDAARAAGGPRFEFLYGDVRDPATCRRAMAGVDCVLHQAALPSVPRSLADPLGTNEVGVTGTLNLLLAARDAGVRRFVYASSSSIYGDTPVLPKHEDLPPGPRSPYAASKLAAEGYVRAFAHAYGLSTISLRYFNVFGPRQDPESEYAAVIPRFLAALRAGRAPIIYGDGTQSRDFTYVADTVRANLLAVDSTAGSGAAFNVACGQRHDLLALLATLNRLLGTAIAPQFAPPRPGDVTHSQASVAAIGNVLGYAPAWSFADGLRCTVEAWNRDR
jgi:nucleoside-diphosphate-sugar epimerase